MTTNHDPDGTWSSAYPVVTNVGAQHYGLSKREYAAIHLCVPSSGTLWLDEMIRERLRDKFAAQCASGLFIRDRNRRLISSAAESAAQAYEWAGQMLTQREKP